MMRGRSLSVWLLAASALLLVASHLPLSLCNVIAPPLISPSLEAPFTPAPTLAAARTAYVAIHFEDHSSSQMSGQDSEASLQGIRVMMASVADPRRGASTRDRVVLVPASTSAESRRQFAGDGLIVLDMDSSLPHSDICAPKFDRIYLWSSVLASRYERVVYLDWDVVVQRPMDHLFLCGQFCMVFNSILHFVDGVMVVKPDPAVFDDMVEKYKQQRLSAAWNGQRHVPGSSSNAVAGTDWRSPSKTMCWEKSYIFFLFWFGNIEAAPLFNPRYGQSPLVLQRMDASIQLNAMMWYEKYSWTLMRGKDYRNMTNDQEVPALSLGYTTLKPFHWGPSLFFNLGWDWSDLRDEYLGVHHYWFVVTRLLLWFACLLFATSGLRKVMVVLYTRRASTPGSNALVSKLILTLRAMHMKILGPTDGFAKASAEEGDAGIFHSNSIWSLSGYWLPRLGSDLLGVIVGASQALILVYLMTAYTALIPMMTAPHPAWRIWFMFHTLGVYAFNHWVFLAYHACPPLIPAVLAVSDELRPMSSIGDSDGAVVRAPLPPPVSSALSRGYPLFSSVAWLASWECLLYVLMRRTFYPEFVVKMFVMFPLFAAILISAINMNRAVWRSIEQAKAQAAGNKEVAAGGVYAPMLPGGGRR